MKNSIKIFAVLAAILTLASCQKEIETITPETRPTHSVSFVADVPMKSHNSSPLTMFLLSLINAIIILKYIYL